MVTPVKAALHPEGLAPGLAEAARPLENPSLASFRARLAELGIPAYDPGGRLAVALAGRGWPQFLRTDTHWTAQAMESAAEGLAEFLRRHAPLPERAPLGLTRDRAWVEGRGDIAALLKLDDPDALFPPERVPVRMVRGPDGELWRPDPGADVLVLGDSFTNVYSQPELGWGEAAGFAEQLAFFLGRPVDRIAVNAGGSSAARVRLASALASGEDRLAGKRLVVYQFTARELSVGDWRLVDVVPGTEGSWRRPEAPLPARGLVTWESNRTGAWRIWTRRLEGSPARQLSPDEPGRQHCCGHLSPDGRRLAYLSREVPDDEYPDLEIAGELKLMDLRAGTERTLVPAARPYGWGNRAVLWNDDARLAYVDADGRSLQIDVTSGRVEVLSGAPRRRLAWLIDPGARRAVDGSPSFSAYDADAGRVVPSERRPGCEPYFTHDRRFGFWVRGGGGPVHWIDLESGEVGRLLEHEDRRIPGAQRYAYFPMISRDGRMLAFGASPGDHDPLPVELRRVRGASGWPRAGRTAAAHHRAPGERPLSRRPRGGPRPRGVAPRRAARAPGRGLDGSGRVALRGPSDARHVLAGPEPARDLALRCGPDRVRMARRGGGGRRGPGRHGARRPLGDPRRRARAIASLAPGRERRLDLEPLTGVLQIGGYPVFDTLPDAPGSPVMYARP